MASVTTKLSRKTAEAVVGAVGVAPGTGTGARTGRKTVGILGGGITGLSAAYYLLQKYGPSSVQPVILESRSVGGGWIRSLKSESNIYEIGPRTIRPVGLSGLHTLDLIQEIGLDHSINFVPTDHPAAKNRLIYLNGKLVRLPMEPSILWRTTTPFTQPLLKTLIKEIFTRRKTAPDDTLHSFISRRFGPQIADTMIDPLIRGICAGDARNISVKFLASGLYELEQKYGSVVLGTLLSKFSRKESQSQSLDNEIPLEKILGSTNYAAIGSSNLARTARDENWSVWTLNDGLQSLPQKLEEKLTTVQATSSEENSESPVKILKNSRVKSITFDAATGSGSGTGDPRDSSENPHRIDYIDTNSNAISSIYCSHIISAIPGWSLSKILQSESGSETGPGNSSVSALARTLSTISSTDVTVSNFKFSQDHNMEAFGFLVPSSQKDLQGLLGVVFNTCAFPQNEGKDTIITAMSQGIPTSKVLTHIQRVLGLDKPLFTDVAELRECIPQYTLGHYERVQSAREIIRNLKLPLVLAGASFDGVSVNDCIMSGRKAAEGLSVLP